MTLLLLNEAGTVYSKKNLPEVTIDVSKLDAAHKEHVRSGMYVEPPAV